MPRTGITSWDQARPCEARDRRASESTMTAMGPADNQIAAAAGTAVMFVEITYQYQPLVANRLLGARTMKYTSAFNVRQRTDQTLKRVGVATADLASCTKFSS